MHLLKGHQEGSSLEPEVAKSAHQGYDNADQRRVGNRPYKDGLCGVYATYLGDALDRSGGDNSRILAGLVLDWIRLGLGLT